MSKKYFINPLAVLFCPTLDKENDGETIVSNYQTENIFKINFFGYDVLRIVETCPGVSLNHWQNEPKIARFIKRMVEENVIFERDE